MNGSERLGDEIRGGMGDIHAYMVDSIQGMREISAFGRGRDRNEELAEKGWDYAGHLVRFQKSQAFQIGFIEAMMGIGGLAVLAMGVWLVLDGQLERTHLPLVSVLALASFSPVTELARTMKQMMETLAASRRILAIHDEAVPVRDGPGVKASKSMRTSSIRRPRSNLKRLRSLTRRAIHKRWLTCLWTSVRARLWLSWVGRELERLPSPI